MRYDQSVHQSAEILRMVLPNFPRHDAAYNPVSYAIWYEYHAGINPPLRQHIDGLLVEGRTIDDELARDIYREYILDAWSTRSLSVNHQLEGLVGHFESSAERVQADADQFNRSWGEFHQQLQGAETSRRRDATEALVESGLRLVGTAQELRTELAASVGETRRLRAELQRLHAEVVTDPLTGLCNRRGLESAFAAIHEQARESGQGCSAIVVDVDHFKKLNDTHGHLFGDQVLRSVAGALRRRSRPSDLVARMGGEEFLIVIPGADAHAGAARAEDIRVTIEQGELRQRSSRDQVARVTISAGVTAMRPQDTPTTMIARADSAMYRAKHRGRNQVAVMA